jgi:hypothetical protein
MPLIVSLMDSTVTQGRNTATTSKMAAKMVRYRRERSVTILEAKITPGSFDPVFLFAWEFFYCELVLSFFILETFASSFLYLCENLLTFFFLEKKESKQRKIQAKSMRESPKWKMLPVISRPNHLARENCGRVPIPLLEFSLSAVISLVLL